MEPNFSFVISDTCDQTPAEAFNEGCNGCGRDLGEDEGFKCTGCQEVFCESHKIAYDGEEACPECALFWSQEAVKKLRLELAKNVDARLRGRSN
jgi:hypothetical protein